MNAKWQNLDVITNKTNIKLFEWNQSISCKESYSWWLLIRACFQQDYNSNRMELYSTLMLNKIWLMTLNGFHLSNGTNDVEVPVGSNFVALKEAHSQLTM